MSIVEIKIPSPGESITEVEIGSWLKADGDYVLIDETICEIETDKATLPLIAESAGRLKILLQEGETAGIGDVACSIDTDAEQPKITSTPTSSEVIVKSEEPSERATIPDEASSASVSYAAGHPSPAARKMMAEQGTTGVSGSGPGGRITTQDVEMHLQQNPDYAASTTETKLEASPPVVSGSRSIKRERMSRLRRKLAERLHSATQNTAMLTTFNEVDMSAILSMRSSYKEAFEKKYSVKLGLMSFFVKAAVESLKKLPTVNGYIDGDDIVYHAYCDVSVAISSDRGLVVPVLRDAHKMAMHDIEKAIIDFSVRAQDGTLGVDEMSGGTFTISNGGVFGSLLSTPILNSPQSAILGMHKTQERPIVVDGEILIRPMMYLALSYDHQIIDGKEAVQFLISIKDALEDPTRLLLKV